MILLNNDALKHSGLSSEVMVSIATIIHHASDSDTASGGQKIAYEFLLSLMGKSKVNLSDLLYHFDTSDVANCIAIHKNGTRMSEFWALANDE